MPLDTKVILERLSFIKYFYYTGLEESRHVYPLNSKSILTFHDAVELFLELVAEHLGKTKSGISFMEYFDLPSPVVSSLLANKASMKRLNKMRASLKHDGIYPPENEIVNIIPAIDSLFIDTTVEVFSLDFEKISLIDLVQFDECKNYLQNAQRYLDEEKIVESLGNCAIAFEMLISDIEERYRSKFHWSPFFFCERRMFSSISFLDIGDLFKLQVKNDSNVRRSVRDFEDFIKALAKSMERINDVLKIVSLGIDYQKYIKFKLYTPFIFIATDSTPNIDLPSHWENEENIPSKENAKFCFDFVIECAVKLQQYISHI